MLNTLKFQRTVSLFSLTVALAALAAGATGCSHGSASSSEISASSFRADPSKMTEADKVRLKALTSGGGAATK